MPTLAKCARCKELFPKGEHRVCPDCWPQEEAEYLRIREILETREGLTVPELASVAQVTLDVVTRMLDGGRLERQEESGPLRCGRCGGPAISASKRLCQGCLITMDQECAEAIRDLRARISGMATAGIHQVHAAVSAKRTGRRLDKSPPGIVLVPPAQGTEIRMVAPQGRVVSARRPAKAGN